MSLKHHPDRNRGDSSATQRFQRVHDAYESFMVALRRTASNRTVGQVPVRP